jgi:hypothetical protein
MRRVLLPVALAAVLVAVPARSPLQACATAPPQGGSVGIASESALIVFDAKAKMQHFLRTANFDTSSSEFGFFVPVPAKPELAEASGEVFTRLATLTAPRIVNQVVQKTEWPDFGFSGVAAKADAAGMAAPYAAAEKPVNVVDSKRIGRFDAVVLQATDAGKLQEWLNENKYATRPALQQWFEVYIRQGWYLVAFKIAAAEGATKTTNEAIRISFPTDVPMYPYREPADAADFSGPKANRLFRLFVMSDARVEGKLGTGRWDEGKTAWSKRVDEPQSKELLAAAKMPEIAGSFVVTEFEDFSSPRKGTDDILFPASQDQSPVERPDIVRTTVEYSTWPRMVLMIVLVLMMMAVPVGAFIVFRKLKRA